MEQFVVIKLYRHSWLSVIRLGFGKSCHCVTNNCHNFHLRALATTQWCALYHTSPCVTVQKPCQKWTRQNGQSQYQPHPEGSDRIPYSSDSGCDSLSCLSSSRSFFTVSSFSFFRASAAVNSSYYQPSQQKHANHGSWPISVIITFASSNCFFKAMFFSPRVFKTTASMSSSSVTPLSDMVFVTLLDICWSDLPDDSHVCCDSMLCYPFVKTCLKYFGWAAYGDDFAQL